MAVNKVVLGNETLIDLTGDTVTANTLLSGVTAHSASGAQITGSYIAPLYLKRIYISTPPTKISYTVGETLDLTGLVVKAVWSDDSEIVITNSVTTSPADGDTLSATDAKVYVTYEWSGADANYVTSQNITIEYPSNAIFGVEWDGLSGTFMERTDDSVGMPDPVPVDVTGTGSSPFDNIMPWSGMVRASNPYSVTNYAGVAIPKFYYTWSKDGLKQKLQISMQQFTGSYVSPAHADRGDGVGERSVVYIGRYPSDSDGRSKSGTTLSSVSEQTRKIWRQYTRFLDTSTAYVFVWDYAIFATLQMLYLVEFADWNIGKKIGYMTSGFGVNNTTGSTDNMDYHTGYYHPYHKKSDGYNGVIQYRNVEGLSSSLVDGVYVNSGNIYAIKNPLQFSESSDGTLIYPYPSTSYGYASAFDLCAVSGFEYFLIPSARDGAQETYACTSVDSTGTVLKAGIYRTWTYNYIQSPSSTFKETRSMILPK